LNRNIIKGEVMFKLFKSIVVVLTISFSALSISQQNIAVVDIDGAVANSNYAKEAQKKLESSESFQKKRGRYNDLGKELQALKKDAQTNGLTWSDEQKRNHNNVAKGKLSEINTIGKQLESEISQINKKMAQELNPKIDEALNSIIKDKKLDLLLKARTVHYFSPQLDITKELLDRLNKA
jgi:outer membrane protein